ncbi:hypothetical protein CRUP_024659 [Coryphaenoides rupestris]|nr:hypothetical protein CRUP_024659 [Coryphaenoides rupestris]
MSSASITDVSLVEPFGSGEVSGRVEPRDGGEFLGHFDSIPAGVFVVRVQGQADSKAKASTVFQRQSSTTLQSSNLTVKSVSENVFVPGTPFLVPFSVVTSDVGGNFTIQVTDNRGFISQFPPSLVLADGGSANGTVTLSAPLNTPSGSDVTLTIQAEAPGGGDTNYIVQRFSIVNTVTDFQAPGCRLIRLQGDCSRDCSMFSWELVVDVSDQSGVSRVDRMQGNGTLITSVVALGSGGEDTTRASYTASCCTPDVVLLVVDSVGNVGTCPYSIREGPIQPAFLSLGTTLTQSCLIWVSLGLIRVSLGLILA